MWRGGFRPGSRPRTAAAPWRGTPSARAAPAPHLQLPGAAASGRHNLSQLGAQGLEVAAGMNPAAGEHPAAGGASRVGPKQVRERLGHKQRGLALAGTPALVGGGVGGARRGAVGTAAAISAPTRPACRGGSAAARLRMMWGWEIFRTLVTLSWRAGRPITVYVSAWAASAGREAPRPHLPWRRGAAARTFADGLRVRPLERSVQRLLVAHAARLEGVQLARDGRAGQRVVAQVVACGIAGGRVALRSAAWPSPACSRGPHQQSSSRSACRRGSTAPRPCPRGGCTWALRPPPPPPRHGRAGPAAGPPAARCTAVPAG